MVTGGVRCPQRRPGTQHTPTTVHGNRAPEPPLRATQPPSSPWGSTAARVAAGVTGEGAPATGASAGGGGARRQAIAARAHTHMRRASGGDALALRRLHAAAALEADLGQALAAELLGGGRILGGLLHGLSGLRQDQLNVRGVGLVGCTPACAGTHSTQSTHRPRYSDGPYNKQPGNDARARGNATASVLAPRAVSTRGGAPRAARSAEPGWVCCDFPARGRKLVVSTEAVVQRARGGCPIEHKRWHPCRPATHR